MIEEHGRGGGSRAHGIVGRGVWGGLEFNDPLEGGSLKTIPLKWVGMGTTAPSKWAGMRPFAEEGGRGMSRSSARDLPQQQQQVKFSQKFSKKCAHY